MRAEDLKGWLEAARRGGKERELRSAAGSETKRLDLGGDVVAH